jgi:uncharacterized membrane protein YfhO
MKKLLPVALIIFVISVFFWQFLLKGLLPIPSDTIVGLYYPFREASFKTNPNGLPYKNFLITDPVRQQIPWRKLVTDAEKKFTVPLWNPYNSAGTPLLANFQSASFYPLNIVFYVFPFNISWSLLIFLQPLLAALFLYLYLKHLKLNPMASLLGAISFSLSGFAIAWLEWGTILNTVLWLPLILLSVDKITDKFQISKIKWMAVFILSLVFSFFAGHLQSFFYLFIFTIFYILVKLVLTKSKKSLIYFVISFLIFFIFSLPQLIPTFQFIALSARSLDLPSWQTNPGWFIPWQNLIQFLSPDFFGNPATLNYYGVWNYGEFIGYIGILPLLMAFFALFFRRDKKTLLFGIAFFMSLIFALPSFISKFPFQLNLAFISTAQPTRLLFITDFSLGVLAALGLDYFISVKNKKPIIYILTAIAVMFVALWSFVFVLHGNIISLENLKVARQNLILPTALFLIVLVIILFMVFSSRRKITFFLLSILILVTILDLFRFGWKFEPFTNKDYLYPSTSITSFLQNQKGLFRVMSTDAKILPPNFSAMYKLQTLDVYDPLYLQRYGELMVAVKRGMPDISPQFGFNRIITPQAFASRIIDLLGTKYILSLSEIKDSKLKLVFTDGAVKVYENRLASSRAFFVDSVLLVNSKQEAIDKLFDPVNSLRKTAIVENMQNQKLVKTNWNIGQVSKINYSENNVHLKTNNSGEGFLVLTDSYYPTWHVKIDGKETQIYPTDYNFRGIIVPKGEHSIEFYDTIF